MKTSKHPKLTNGQPAISCFALSQAELAQRQTAAHERAKRLARQQQDLPHLVGRTQLWHKECPQGLILAVCDEPLFLLTAVLPAALLEMNGGQALDFFDYGYVADVLREALLDFSVGPGDAQNLCRALAWAEGQGSMKRDHGKE